MYTKLARFVAFCAVALGLLRMAMGFIVSFGFDGDPGAISRYLGSVQNTGEAIDQGLFVLLFGIALGVACEISQSLKRIVENNELHDEVID